MRDGPLRTAAPGPDGFDVGSDPIGEGGVCLVRLFTGFLTAASAEVLRKGAGTSGDRSDAPEEDDGVRVRLDELSARRGTTLTGPAERVGGNGVDPSVPENDRAGAIRFPARAALGRGPACREVTCGPRRGGREAARPRTRTGAAAPVGATAPVPCP